MELVCCYTCMESEGSESELVSIDMNKKKSKKKE